jgi:hypothetical protein
LRDAIDAIATSSGDRCRKEQPADNRRDQSRQSARSSHASKSRAAQRETPRRMIGDASAPHPLTLPIIKP